ncbi:hypothetical protein HDR66_03545 [bacterium]|nr:hypothetical protein [bacterium]
MSRFYSLLPAALFREHNFSKIPHNANTHYTYYIFPTKVITPKTVAGAMRKPLIQRRNTRTK